MDNDAQQTFEQNSGSRFAARPGYLAANVTGASHDAAGSSGSSKLHDGGTNTLRILAGDCRKVLRDLATESVQCCVTSPPYWGLRDYGIADQIGLEKTPDDYVAEIVAVMREVWRVLKADGTLWLNLGDSYAGSGKGPSNSISRGEHRNMSNIAAAPKAWTSVPKGIKAKDLVGIPWLVAFALRAEGWYLRSDIIWAKANCMPESVRDRPTRSHEYLFLLTKSERYFYDADAIKEPASEADWESRIGRANLNNKLLPTEEINGIRPRVKYTPNKKDKQRGHSRRHDGFNDRWDDMERAEQCSGMRNKRDVWTVAPANYLEAHFATFPAALISPCILAGSRPGDVVLDPFGGSGTTGATALTLGRKAILIELNPDYAKLIEQRTNTTLGLAL